MYKRKNAGGHLYSVFLIFDVAKVRKRHRYVFYAKYAKLYYA